MDNEIWKDVCGYEGLYAVSNMGRVKSLNYRHTRKEKILRQCKNIWGYLFVNLWKNGEHKIYQVHRLVLSTFSPIANMSELLVNHKDECKTNNNLSNLEWCTKLYNNTYNDRHKRVGEKLRGKTRSAATKKKISEALSKPIVQIDVPTNKGVNVWSSGKDAEREGGFNNGNVSQCCKNKFHREGNNIYKGYKWQYLHDYISQIDPRIKKIMLFGKEYTF